MTDRNHAATILGIPPTPTNPAALPPRPRALVYVEAGRVEVIVTAPDGIVLDAGDARLLAAALMQAASEAGPTEADHRAAFGWDAVEEGAAFERDLDAHAAGDLDEDRLEDGLPEVGTVIGNALLAGAPHPDRAPNSGSPADVLNALEAAGYRVVPAEWLAR